MSSSVNLLKASNTQGNKCSHHFPSFFMQFPLVMWQKGNIYILDFVFYKVMLDQNV